MPSFRRHLLTWLFFIAAACWATAGLVQHDGQMSMMLVLSGSIYVVGAWAAVGKSHRLLRGGILFGVPLGVAFVVLLLAPFSTDEAATVLAFGLIAAMIAYASALLTALAIRHFVSSEMVPNRRWRISLAEMLGWMIVTAIASFALSKSQMPEGTGLFVAALYVASAIPSGITVALFLAPRTHFDRAAVVISGAAIILYDIIFSFLTQRDWEEGFYEVYVFGFVALWILCVRLDEGALAAKEAQPASDGADEATPRLKLHEESPDGE